MYLDKKMKKLNLQNNNNNTIRFKIKDIMYNKFSNINLEIS